MRTHKPLWHEGVILAPHHFQQQEAWLLHLHRQQAATVVAEPWGIIDVGFDEQALAAGRLSATCIRLCFPDGTLFDSDVTDALPPVRFLDRDANAGLQSMIVHADLPLLRAEGGNCRLDDDATHPHRFHREVVSVEDARGKGLEDMAVERQSLRLAFDHESRADMITCPIARVVRDTRGRFSLDKEFVAPCLVLSSHERHGQRIDRVIDLLGTTTSLRQQRAEGAAGIAKDGAADIASFGFLQCMHAAWARLGFLASHPYQPPERLYLVLSELAAGLMVFSTRHSLSALPRYDHTNQDTIFASLEATIRDIVDDVIASRSVLA